MKKTLKERKREDIINAAITEFRKNGYMATNMDLISKTA
jgi:AcrR family transcriptional regulator